ncbi:3-oxoacyl-[acyl-carrier-protein] reductase [Stratiformator vulcanicus]|uniref:3-oxoacyl-[acyl-carrier-protein] reductase n=1 Tax=Stratiformator vulcanicus TaxID=2527980 RepID=A0A517R0K5_9PLAN|nr:3-oxoacyl-[acyl-carrier-protein] reductase [Stratiformator vulcanicus]QDT37427.1 3-oxoacyl-[acyl-carrier-protein] reductase FabG [Stratiformator vulcanicus]
MILEGRTALVTGGSRGIGRAIVERFAAEGAKVAFVYHSNKEAADELIASVKDAGGEAHGFQCDVKSKAEADAVVEKVVEQFGTIDILVNNAGVVRDTLVATMSEEKWLEVIQTNLTSVYNFCNAVMRPMMSARYGRIINMSSVAARVSNQGQAAYAASKGGVEGFTRCLAVEVAKRKITVNAVAPGFIATDMTVDVRNAAEDKIIKEIPVRRLGQPEDIANAVLFLADERTSYITGDTITVDGGLTLGGI